MNRTAICYAALFALPFVVQASLAIGLSDAASVESPLALFWLVVVAAGLCVVASVLVLWRAFQTDVMELAWLGLFFFSASILPFVHGLTTPGILYGPNAATMSSVILAVPLGLLAALPNALPRNGHLYRQIARCWRGWTRGAVATLVLLSAALLVFPNMLPTPTMRSTVGVITIASAFTACAILGWRHVQLAQIARSRGPLFVCAGYALIAGSTGVFLGSAPYSAGFWFAHAIDITGVFSATIGGFIVYRRSGSMTEVLAPIVALDPVAALEVGMDPEIRAFVADLDAKDRLTRDHVIRTAELAIEVAAELGLAPEDQRRCGLVGALHDIGKLRIPHEILTKPGALDDDEWKIMRSHAELGADIVADRPSLADLAPAIRAHHERLDGGGYPDGLADTEIPIEARVVSACDAYDAMAYTRHYRDGRDFDDVVATLREHAGTQWDAVVVAALIRVAERQPLRTPTLLQRDELAGEDHELCDCLPAAV